MRGIAMSLAVLGACYSPSLERCVLRCAANGDCPEDLACNAQGRCASSANDVCTATGDGGVDAPLDVAGCTWATSNVDACNLGAHMVTRDVQFPSGTTSINTDTLATTLTGVQLTATSQGGGMEVALLMVRDLSFATTSSLVEIRGRRPLIILVNGTALITGTFRYLASNTDASCPGAGGAGTPTSDARGASGGGGGTYGESGARGGDGGTAGGLTGPAGGRPGAVLGMPSLVPIGPGCPGGAGGAVGSNLDGGLGGAGGGALQISARVAINAAGVIFVGGGGGGGGGGMNAAISRGAGGGGSGGALLLEAPMLQLANSSLCAAGGAGGGTSTTNGLGQGAITCAVAMGGDGLPSSDGDGGEGAGLAGGTIAVPTAGSDGLDASLGHGGGGGGGGFGRIRLNGTILTQPRETAPGFTTN